MNDTSDIFSTNNRADQQDYRPERCVIIKESTLLISDVDLFFYRYIILTLVALGLLLNIFYWAVLRSSSVPIGSLYNRFLIFISLMEVLQLVTILLEAIWKLVLRLEYLAISGVHTSGMSFILLLLFCPRALSIYCVIFTVSWLNINCLNDIKFFDNGNTGSLLDKLNDFRGYKSIGIILLISLCITAITEISVSKMQGPFCVISDDYMNYMYMYFQVSRKEDIFYILRVIKAVIPLCVITFILILLVTIVLRLKESTAFHHQVLVTCRSGNTRNETTTENKGELLPCGPSAALNDNGNGPSTQCKDETNDIQLMFFYLIIPLTVQYLLLWSPYYIINSLNVIKISKESKDIKVTNHYVVWVCFTMRLLTSCLNPIFFIFANWKYYQTIILEGCRSRRVTQETNV